jgi:hypothetical protein
MESTEPDSRWSGAHCAGLAASNPKKYDKVFFPTKGRPNKDPEYKKICNGCPIVAFCLSYAILYDEEGNWGGMTRIERDRLIRTNPKLKSELLAEAVRQGWYEPRPSIDYQIQVLRKKEIQTQILLVEIEAEFDFDWEFVPSRNLDIGLPDLPELEHQSDQIPSEYASQTQPISLPLLVELLGEVRPQIAPPSVLLDQSIFHFVPSKP